MAIKYDAKVSLPTFDELVKPLVYIRESQDKADEKITALTSEINKYKYIAEKERAIDPNSILVTNFDKYQNELNQLAEGVMQYGHTRSFSKLLNNSVSTYSGLVPMYEQSQKNREKAIQTWSTLKMNPNNILREEDDPTKRSFQSFYDNDFYAPTPLNGDQITEDIAKIWGPISKGISSASIEGNGKYVNKVRRSGLNPEIMVAVKQAIGGDFKAFYDLKLDETTEKALINGINTTQATLSNYGKDWSKANLSRIDDYTNRGLTFAAETVNKDITGNPSWKPALTKEEKLAKEARDNYFYGVLRYYGATEKKDKDDKPTGEWDLSTVNDVVGLNNALNGGSYDGSGNGIFVNNNNTPGSYPGKTSAPNNTSKNNGTVIVDKIVYNPSYKDADIDSKYKRTYTPLNERGVIRDLNGNKLMGYKFPPNNGKIYSGQLDSGNLIISKYYSDFLVSNVYTAKPGSRTTVQPNVKLTSESLLNDNKIIYVRRGGPTSNKINAVNKYEASQSNNVTNVKPFITFVEGTIDKNGVPTVDWNSEDAKNGKLSYYDVYHPVQLSDIPDNIKKDMDASALTEGYIFYPRLITKQGIVTHSDIDLVGVYVGNGMVKELFNK